MMPLMQEQGVAPGQQQMGLQIVNNIFDQYVKPVGNFTIQGSQSQLLHVILNKGEQILTEAGAMRYYSPGISPTLKMGQCMAACCGGESLFRVIYTNDQGQNGSLIGVAPPFNANILPVSLDLYPELIIKGGAFLAATDVNLQINTERVKSLGAACGGQGVLIHPLVGTGTVFLNAGGTIMFRTLKAGEVFYGSTHSIVAFQKSCQFTVERVQGGMMQMCCGGQGLFNTKLVGPGLVILQSISLEELKMALSGPEGGGGAEGGADCLTCCCSLVAG